MIRSFVRLAQKNVNVLSLIRPFGLQQNKYFLFNENPKTKASEVVSLSSVQMGQLLSINHYTLSNTYLEKENLDKAYHELEYSLTEAKVQYAESINLHLYLLNRMSILQKIRGMEEELVLTLQEMFFICLSLKGEKSLDTYKNLHNYLISLILYAPQRGQSICEFLVSEKLRILLRKSQFLRAILQLQIKRQNQLNYTIQAVEKWSPSTSSQTVSKMNNLSWLRILNLLKRREEKEQFNFQEQGYVILEQIIMALIKSQKQSTVERSSENYERLMTVIGKYTKQNGKLAMKLQNSVKIQWKNPDSTIVSMNIAYLLYYLSKYEECQIFIKATLDSALLNNEIERVGFALILMAKVNFKFDRKWQQILLDILENRQSYTKSVLKQCLKAYSQLLLKQNRYIEVQNYLDQMQRIEDNIVLEGLIIPEFDFSF